MSPKNRPIADQPPPTPNKSTPIWDLVIDDMQDRKDIGIERYGTPLQANNGRDMLVDAYQEALDLVVYLRGYIEERVTRQRPPVVNDLTEYIVGFKGQGQTRIKAKDVAEAKSFIPKTNWAYIDYIRPVEANELDEQWSRLVQSSSVSMPDPLPDPNSFIERFDRTMHEAQGIVIQRDAEGRNAEISVRDQFPGGARFVVEIIQMKCARALSYLRAGNYAKFKEEMDDCINYSGFAIVFEGMDRERLGDKIMSTMAPLRTTPDERD